MRDAVLDDDELERGVADGRRCDGLEASCASSRCRADGGDDGDR